MYEVFLNDRSIILSDTGEPVRPDEQDEIVTVSSVNTLREIVIRFLSEERGSLYLTGQIDWLWAEFQQIFKLLPAAGGLVHGKKGFLFIFRRGKWDLPKGKIEPGETDREAALREVSEETGLNHLTIEKSCPSTWHIYCSPYKNSKGEWILKETKWFSMTASENDIPRPETEEDIMEVRWVPVEKLNEILNNTYSSLKNLIKGLQC